MKRIGNSHALATLIVGDLVAYLFSLILTLAIRYGEIPSQSLFASHLFPSFSILFIIFILVAFSAGLYDKQSAFLRKRIQSLIIRTQVIDIFIGVAFFYSAPVTIAPKANLIIYFIVSTLVLALWRLVMIPILTASRPQSAVLVGNGEDVTDLYTEVNTHGRYGLMFATHIQPQGSVEEIVAKIKEAVDVSHAITIVADLHDQSIEAAMPFLYKIIFSGVKVIDAGKFYESIFDRIPISLVGERWLVENSGTALGLSRTYDALKRIMDIVIACCVGIVSLFFYPCMYLAIKMDDRGPIFITQNRVGKNGKVVKVVKFRSMSGNDAGNYGSNGTSIHKITRVGSFIRGARLDEFPQLWNVIKGDLSLVGPRPELPNLVEVYEKEIPYYSARHLVKPGLSGWAQIYHDAHPHHEVATEATRDKLSYDLYYIKNRSFMLDLKIALRTLQILMGRSGR